MGQNPERTNDSPHSAPPGPLRFPFSLGPAVFRRLVLLRPGEGPALAWAAAYFFFLLFAYFIIRPIRDEMGVAGGINNLRWLWTGTLVAMLLAHPVYSWIVGRLPRRRFIPLVYRFFIANLIGFYLLITLTPDAQHVNIGRAFYIWTSVFNLFAVVVFWSFMADTFSHEQGKRLFGAIAVGGSLGAMAGSATTALLASGVEVAGSLVKPEPAQLLLASAVLLEAAVFCMKRVAARRGTAAFAGRISAEPSAGVWTGMLLIARSPYLLLIALYMLCYTVTSAFLYVEQARIAESQFADRGERTAFFAQVNFYISLGTVVIQVFITGRVLRALGVGGTLLAMPLAIVAGFSALLIHPAVWTLIIFQVASRALHFAIDKPTREVLYTVLGPDEKYKSKHFIDTFVYRAGDQIGIWGQSFLAYLAVPGAAAAIGVGAAWGGVALALGARHRRELLLRAPAATPPRPHPPTRPSANRCPACGYNLAGVPNDHCPSCGGGITDPPLAPPSVGPPRSSPRTPQ